MVCVIRDWGRFKGSLIIIKSHIIKSYFCVEGYQLLDVQKRTISVLIKTTRSGVLICFIVLSLAGASSVQ